MKSTCTISFLLGVSSFTFAQNIPIHADRLYPEGTAYSKKQNVFFISSVNKGQIGKLDVSGNYTPFTQDPDLVATVGILADEKSNTLFVTNIDNGAAVKTNPAKAYKLSEVIGYDLKSGKRKFKIDVGKLNPGHPNFINDLTLDNEGNVYVTNSFSPVIFKIDKDHHASIFAQNEAWTGEGFNLNGIVYHPEGYLIVAQSNKGLLYKINIKNPNDVKVIKVDELKGADGLILNDRNELVVVSNASSKIFQVRSTDNWTSASILSVKESILPFPTTGVLVNGKYHVLNAKLSELFDPNAPKTSDFLLQEITF
jgi:sugar lactone lactonase YvrE